MEGVFQHDQFTLHALFIEHPIHQVRIRSQRLIGIAAHLDRRELLQLIEIGTGDLRISSVGLRRKHLHKRIKSFRLDRIVDDIVDLLEQTSRFSLSDRHKALFYINDTLCFFRDHREYDPLIRSENFTMELLYKRIEERIGMDLPTKNSHQRRYTMRFLLNGSYGLIKEWILNGRKEDVEAISKLLYDLCTNAVH